MHDIEFRLGGAMNRRQFLKYSSVTIGSVSLGSMVSACGGGTSGAVQQYPIDAIVTTTLERMVAFPFNKSSTPPPALAPNQLDQIPRYAELGYGKWTFGSGLPMVPRTDIMPAGYGSAAPVRKTRFLNFFAFTDIHITDKEAPNQLMRFQQIDKGAYGNTSIYSGVMMYTTHVLDAAVQTINVLHRRNPFDFGISLGDTCNSTSYNELRWYLDVIDGKDITPSSGAHAGADTIDFQKQYQAAGLDKSIPWYQAMGNHDHFMIGSFAVDADPSRGFRQSYVADTIWAIGDPLVMDQGTAFPANFNIDNFKSGATFYPGRIDGTSVFGRIMFAGATTDTAFAAGAPKVVADPDRRSLARSEWVQEYFNTTTHPVGHGFNLVDKTNPAYDSNGFTCYSFLPNPKVPVKMIVLDCTQSENDGSKDIHGHGYLDAKRWAWLQGELAKGQADNQLMVIAAHIPIAVSAIGSETEWWAGDANMKPGYENAVNLGDLVKTLQSTPNLLMWIAGHRHVNVVKAFPSTDSTKPEQGFWQVESSSLRDFPQQFRTFEIFLNSDYTISIVTLNVDPAVADGTPAATSRSYAVAAQQIVKSDLQVNCPNYLTVEGLGVGYPQVASLDPTRTQSDDPTRTDPTIRFVDLSNAAKPVPYNGSYNCELFKQLSPKMVNVLKGLFPPAV